jgi:hypothetical protein
VALILFVMTLGMFGAFLTFASPAATSTGLDRVTQESFQLAREALIWRAAQEVNRPGSLPCPDTNNDGQAELFVGTACPNYIGRLPWRTLGLPDLRDGTGERLWYALSPAMRDKYTGAPPLNSTTAGNIVVTGTVPADDVAAIVIAPGAALAGQDRASNPDNAAFYLEGDNADGGNDYVTGVESATFNDHIAVIKRAQLFHAVEWRIANEVRATLAAYYGSNGYFPFANDPTSGGFDCTEGQLSGRVPNPNSAGGTAIACTGHANWDGGLGRALPTWFFENDWHLLTYYALAPACTIATSSCTGSGFLSVNGVAGKRAVVIVGSRALATQTPACVGALCTEQPLAGSYQYLRLALSTSYNDKLAIIP